MTKKPLRLSQSGLRIYNQCGRRYKHHYIDRLRPIVISGALLFGNALDKALNELLSSKDIKEARKVFDDAWNRSEINEVVQDLAKNTNIAYAESDFDVELLNKEDIASFDSFVAESGYKDNSGIAKAIKELSDKKKSVGLTNMSTLERQLLAYANWLSMRRKGYVMLSSYKSKVLPTIENVLAIQENITLENDQGDKVPGVVDLIVQFKDGTRYLMDNKTSSRAYEADSAMTSQQLIVYYHALKEEYKLDGVGFIVLYKNITKNKKKICSKCEFDGSGTAHRTCNNMIGDVRCMGEWDVKINPSCFIEVIKNKVSEIGESLVLNSFDENAEAIKKGIFNPNLTACKQGNMVCPYFNKCWYGKDDDLIDLNKK